MGLKPKEWVWDRLMRDTKSLSMSYWKKTGSSVEIRVRVMRERVSHMWEFLGVILIIPPMDF